MVLKTQKRIGLIFFYFSLVILVYNVIKSIQMGGAVLFSNWIEWRYILYPILFGISYIISNKTFQYIQVFLMYLEGNITILESSYDSFFGIMFICCSILLSVSYGHFEKNKKLKAVLIGLTLFLGFYLLPKEGSTFPLITSLIWTLFVITFIGLMYTIFKDWLDLWVLEKNNAEIKLVRSLEDLQRKVEEYSEISHLSIETNKELLGIVKDHLKDSTRGSYDRE